MKKTSKKNKSDFDVVLQYFTLSTRSKWSKLETQYNWDYNNVIESSYDRVYNCKRYGCDSICRCSNIENIELSNFDCQKLIDVVTKDLKDEIIKYCVDRIIRLQNLNEGSFESDVVRGYYGEEFNGIYLNDSENKSINNHLLKIKDLSNIDKIKYIITMEYGFLLDSLKNLKEIKIISIPIEKITFQEDYRKKININENYYDDKFALPRGIFIENGFNFKLVDGYHRIAKAQTMGYENIKGIILL